MFLQHLQNRFCSGVLLPSRILHLLKTSSRAVAFHLRNHHLFFWFLKLPFPFHESIFMCGTQVMWQDRVSFEFYQGLQSKKKASWPKLDENASGKMWCSLIKQLCSAWFPGARISGCPNVLRGLSTKRLDFDDSGQPRSVQGISQNQNVS